MPRNTFTIRNAPGLYLQQAGRAIRGRLVHAQRARKLRRRGEDVRFAGWSPSGLAQYRWHKRPRIIDFPSPLPRSAAECEFGDEEYQWRLRQEGM